MTNQQKDTGEINNKVSNQENNKNRKNTYSYRKNIKTGKTRTNEEIDNDNINLMNKINNQYFNELVFIPASGVEQIGMNLNLFLYQGQYIVVDVGISFSQLGSGITMPSMNLLYTMGEDKILGYVITHGHEDHIGALCRFLKKINKPIYATKFTMCLIEKKIKENNVRDTTRIIVEAEKEFSVGPFDIIFTYTAHSIPDSNHIIIKTPNASIFHTGDWKFDDQPMIGEKLNKNYLSSLAKKHDITVLINDSTNAFEFNKVGTEGEAYEGLLANILEFTGKKVIVSCFASNVARIISIFKIAKITGRYLILVGRSLVNMANIAIQNKLLENSSHIILDVKKADHIPADKCLYICTGSQGEINSVLQRCAFDLHPHLKINTGDVLILSSRIIPGNEQEISSLKNTLIDKGVIIIDHNLNKNKGVLHVSGHPGREDIKEMIKLIECKWIIPVHGDAYHLYAVKEIIEELKNEHPDIKVKCKIPQGNGTVFSINKDDGINIIGKFATGTDVVDGKIYYNINDLVFKQRSILNEHGIIVIFIDSKKKSNFIVNYGAVSKTEWEKFLRKHLYNIIAKSNYDTEELRNEITYEIYQRYEKNPIVILNII